MNTIDIKNTKTADLVAFWNEHNADKPIKKFADRKTAERRCHDLQVRLTQDWYESEQAKHDIQVQAQGDVQQAADYDLQEKPTLPKRSRSEGVAESWKRMDVAKKRVTRHKVVVDGELFDSVRQAFDAFGLPIEKHIRFRMNLKKEGALNGFGKHWEIATWQDQ